MATLQLLHLCCPQTRLYGHQPLESSWKQQSKGVRDTPIFISKRLLMRALLLNEAPPEQSLRGMAELKASVAIVPKRVKQLEESSIRESKSQLRWEKMMKEIAAAGSAIAVLSSHREAGKLSKKTVVGTLVRLKQLQLWATVIDVLEWLREQEWWKFGLEDQNLLVAAYGKQGEPEKAEIVLSQMRDAGVAPTVAPHTSLIEAYAQKGLYDKAESIFKQMLESGPAPTLATYQTYIRLLHEGGKSEEAGRIFTSMTQGDTLKPDERLYNYMIHSYGKSGKVAEAQALLREMKGLGLLPSSVTFNSLMSSQKSVPDAEAVLRQMQLASIKPDVVTYTALINVYSKSRRVEEAQAVFREMVASGIRPTRITYNALLDAYAKAKELEGAETVFKKMAKDRCRPDIHSYTTLMAAYVNVGDMAKAEKLLLRMKKEGIQPNVVTFGTLMLGYASVRNTEALLRTFRRMQGAGIKPNQTIYTVLVRNFGQEAKFDSAFTYFKEMLAAGCTADQKSRTALMEACQSSEQKQEVLEYLGTIS